MQIAILESIHENLDSTIFNIQDTMAFEYESNKPATANANKVMKVTIRVAGALAGVTIVLIEY